MSKNIRYLFKLCLSVITCAGLTVHAQETLLLDPAKEIDINHARLIQLVHSLESATIQQQYEFIQIALLEMQHAYGSEIKKSSKAFPTTAKKKQKLLRWQFATQNFINELDNYLLLLDSHVFFSLGVSRQQKVLIVIDSQPVIINGPNLASHKRMQQNIVQQFCQFNNCSLYLDALSLTSELNDDIFINANGDDSKLNNLANSSGSWLFSSRHGPIYMTHQGIHCEFNNSTEKKDKETVCLSLAGEITRVTEILQDAAAAGSRIDPEQLSLKPLSDVDMVQIQINQQGYHLNQSLPLLQKNPEIFSEILPALTLNNDTYQLDIIISHADRLLQ